jgi:signal transduction histidine kinase
MSLKLRTRAALLIAVSFAALLATFLILTFLAVKSSYEARTIEEMRSQLRAILQEVAKDSSRIVIDEQYVLHGRTGESPLAVAIWSNDKELARLGADSLRSHLPSFPVPMFRPDTTFTAYERFVVYAQVHEHLRGAAVMSEHTTDEIIEEMIEIFDVVLIVGILLSIFVAIVLARVALDPISRLTASTDALIGRTKLGSRLPVPNSPQEAITLAERFNKLLEERDKSVNTLKNFTADVAHELRTPLTILRGELEVELRSRPHEVSERETLESCLEEVKHLSVIVDDLLYLARLENVAEAMHDKTDVSMADSISSVTSRLDPLAVKKKISVLQEVSPDISIYASPAYVERMFYNLILNAIQYTPEGGRVEIHSRSNAIEIRDTGVGMSPETIKRVTERFYRADSSRNRDQGNIGLGLAIARGIAERYGLVLSFQSELGKGTRVLITFPVKV